MARYIDLEELERRIKENVPTSGCGNTPYEVDLLEWCKDECIRQGYAMPTADVAPKSEVITEFAEKLKKYYRHIDKTAGALIEYTIDQKVKEFLEGGADDA